MTEGSFVDMIVAAGFVVEDDEKYYHVKRLYNAPSLIVFSRDFVARCTEDDIAQMLAIHIIPPTAQYKPLTIRGYFKEVWLALRSRFQRRTS